jgi:hypothetical protein
LINYSILKKFDFLFVIYTANTMQYFKGSIYLHENKNVLLCGAYVFHIGNGVEVVQEWRQHKHANEPVLLEQIIIKHGRGLYHGLGIPAVLAFDFQGRLTKYVDAFYNITYRDKQTFIETAYRKIKTHPVVVHKYELYYRKATRIYHQPRAPMLKVKEHDANVLFWEKRLKMLGFNRNRFTIKN